MCILLFGALGEVMFGGCDGCGGGKTDALSVYTHGGQD
jgi:hypothetical protein